MADKQYISLVKLGDITYHIKDNEAREAVANLGKGNVTFIGITSTKLKDGATDSTLTAKADKSLTKTTGFVNGDMVQYEEFEFIWISDHWAEAGRGSKLGTLAGKSSATSSSLFAKSDHKHSVTGGSHSHSIPSISTTVSGNYTPTGNISVATDNTGSTKVITSVKNVGAPPTVKTVSIKTVKSVGSMFKASVEKDVLILTPGEVPILTTDDEDTKIGSVTAQGSMPTFNTGTLQGGFTGNSATITLTGQTETGTTGDSDISEATVGNSTSNSTVTVS